MVRAVGIIAKVGEFCKGRAFFEKKPLPLHPRP